MRLVALDGHRRADAEASWHFTSTYRNSLFTTRANLKKRGGAARRSSMLDMIMLALGLALFVAAIGYTYACERL